MVSTKSAGDSLYDGIEERTIELASETREDQEGSSLRYRVRKCVTSSGVVLHSLQEASPPKQCFVRTLNLAASDSSPRQPRRSFILKLEAEVWWKRLGLREKDQSWLRMIELGTDEVSQRGLCNSIPHEFLK